MFLSGRVSCVGLPNHTKKSTQAWGLSGSGLRAASGLYLKTAAALEDFPTHPPTGYDAKGLMVNGKGDHSFTEK